MFETFFLPGLQALSERYNGIGIHCCASARHQWDNLLKIPGIFLLNLHIGDDRYDFFETRVVHYHHIQPDLDADMSLQEIDDRLSEVVCRGGRRTVLNYTCDTKKEAVTLAEKLQEVRDLT